MNFKSGMWELGLWRALAVSLALHALLLAQALPRRVLPAAGQPLMATLRPVGHAPESPAPRPPAPPTVATTVLPKPVRKLPAAPPVIAAAAPGVAPTGSSAPVETARGSPMAGARVAMAPVAGKAESGTVLDADGVRQYRVSLAAAARRFTRYPALALASGWSGRAQVELAVAAGGAPRPPRLMDSSGHALLDQAALEMIGRAAQVTTVPPSLRGRVFVVKLPVVFDLDEE